MAEDRSRYGLVVSALGGAVLAVAVYLPWYGVTVTPVGVAAAQRVSEEVAGQLGNGALQGYLAPLHGALASLAGHELTSLSAHDALRNIGVVLVVLAALCLLDALVPLVRSGRPPAGAGAASVLLGLLATGLVLFRILVPPAPAGEYITLSPREGAWLALVAALAILAGGLWPRAASRSQQQHVGGTVWSGLSGWTPES
jgi:hypothetical protein